MFFRHLADPSLERQLGLGLALGLVVIFLMQTAAVFWIASRLAEQNVLDHLEHETETLLGISAFEGSRLRFRVPLQALQYHRPFSGHYYELQGGDGPPLRSRSLWDAKLPENSVRVGESRHMRRKMFDQSLLILQRAFEREGRVVRITVAEEMEHQNRLTERLMLADASVFAVAVLLLWWWQQWSLRRTMRVLQRLRQDMQDLWDGRRDRLQIAHAPSEIQPLIYEFNAMIDRLQHRMQRTRLALGDLAHSLKTPLARIHQLLDAGEWNADMRAQLRQACEQIQQRVERELRIARLSGIKAVPGRLALHREASDLIDAMRTLYPEKDLRLHCSEALCLMADREDVMELLGNLLDNACKWATARVRLRLSYEEGVLQAVVEDDGPGMPDDALPILQQRGTRLDERKAGHGLGLSIVAAIVREYEGEWHARRSEKLGGACIVVRLPLRSCLRQQEACPQPKP